MATLEEKQETIEALKGPRYYRVTISGYGGESAYMSISQEAYEFWKNHTEEFGDSDLVTYMVSATDGDAEYEELQDVPNEADFLHDADDDFHRPWYESHTEFEHTYGANYDSSWITVEEVDSADYDSNIVTTVLERTSIQELYDQIGDNTEWDVSILDMNCCEEPDAQYIAQMYSSEKGCFFDGVIETVGEFDPKKLKIYATEFLNGEDTITDIEYDGVAVDNNGGDTNGKGYSAAVWEA